MISGPTEAPAFFAYTDESGNTGLNIFDSQQPYFWTGTLLCRSDLEIVDHPRIRSCHLSLGVSELHANDLGLARLETVADHLREFIVEEDFRFIFTHVEKRHMAGTKLADLILDSGVNPAACAVAYCVRPLKFRLEYILCSQLSPQGEREFWEGWRQGDLQAFCRVLRRLRWNIVNRVGDRRAQTLLIEPIDWALEHPNVILDERLSRLHAPNIVAFCLLINELHRFSRGAGIRVGSFVHDQQSQFDRDFQQAYECMTRFEVSTALYAVATDIEPRDTYACPLRIGGSHELIGLQIVDVALWLVRRQAENPWQGFDRTTELMVEILGRSNIARFSRVQMATEITLVAQDMASMPPLSPEQDTAAREQVERWEQIRLARRRQNAGEQ